MSETVYLIHLERPIGAMQSEERRSFFGLPPHKVEDYEPHAQHYIGWTTNLDGRLDDHRTGRGAAILRAAGEAGIGWQVVRTWEGGRDLENKLKARKNARAICPVCNPIFWRSNARG